VNIFASSDDPVACARALDDKRVNKMIVESCQILSTVLHLKGCGSPDLYKPAYVNHPILLWSAQDARNYAWLFRHVRALFDERAFRTGNRRHLSQRLMPLLGRHARTKRPPTGFLNCTPFKDCADVHAAYRATLCDKWRTDIRPPVWSRRGPPDFFRPARGAAC
jgi:hypothetical protein